MPVPVRRLAVLQIVFRIALQCETEGPDPLCCFPQSQIFNIPTNHNPVRYSHALRYNVRYHVKRPTCDTFLSVSGPRESLVVLNHTRTHLHIHIHIHTLIHTHTHTHTYTYTHTHRQTHRQPCLSVLCRGPGRMAKGAGAGGQRAAAGGGARGAAQLALVAGVLG